MGRGGFVSENANNGKRKNKEKFEFMSKTKTETCQDKFGNKIKNRFKLYTSGVLRGVWVQEKGSWNCFDCVFLRMNIVDIWVAYLWFSV